MTRKTLVMWSGGLDSTYGLVRTLTETDGEVFVHHLHRLAPPDRLADQDSGNPSLAARYEADACGKMLAIFKERYRPFAYSESLVDLAAFPVFARDAVTVMLKAGLVARQLGFGPDDEILDVMNSDEDADWDLSSPSGQALRRSMQSLLQVLWQSDAVPKLSVIEPVPTKRQQVEYLPPDIVALNASCRAPQLEDDGWKSCGVCRKCLTYRAMGLRADGRIDPALAVPTPAQPLDDPERIIEFRRIGRKRSLVMWSGGPASTVALEHLLRDTDDEVHVHHIRSNAGLGQPADENGFGGHAQADIKRTFAALRGKYRRFSATVSTIGPLHLLQLTHPINVVSYFAAQGAMTWRMTPGDRIVLGSYGPAGAPEMGNTGTGRREGCLMAPILLQATIRSGGIPELTLGRDLVGLDASEPVARI
jgi:hypothetical protein